MAIIVIAAVTMTLAANAQAFIEGNLSVSYSNDEKTDFGSKYSNSSIRTNISPKIGFLLNDKFAIGGSMSIIIGSGNSDSINYNEEHHLKIRDLGLGFSIFSRYKILEKGKFSLLVEGSTGIQRITTKTNFEHVEKSGVQWGGHNKYEMFSFGISIAPVVSYDITDNISIITTSDFLSLNFLHSINKDEYSNRNTSNNFGFGAKSTIFSSLEGIRIGFIYKFNN